MKAKTKANIKAKTKTGLTTGRLAALLAEYEERRESDPRLQAVEEELATLSPTVRAQVRAEIMIGILKEQEGGRYVENLATFDKRHSELADAYLHPKA